MEILTAIYPKSKVFLKYDITLMPYYSSLILCFL